MENGGFQSQVLSVMEVLAKAAVAEINRRVDDSCALLRLEVSQSRRDIALLKRKCEAMEAELRRTRMRAKRRAAERLCPLNKERPRTDWDRRTPSHPQPEAADEAERVRVKEEDGLWKNSPQDKPTSGPEEPCFQAHRSVHIVNMDHYPSAEKPNSTGPALDYDAFPERLNQNQNGQEIVVKLEKEEPDENAAPLDSDHRFMTQGGDRQLCSNRDTGESNFSRAGRECEQISTVDLQEMGLKSVVVSATRMKRRSRMFGCKTPQPDEGHSTLFQLNSVHQSSSPPQSQDPYRNSAPQARDPNEVLTAATPAASALRACSRASFSLARRMRTPWTSGISEKRFNCTYCDKSFMRFSQLKEHQRSHTGEKPFSCLLCGRSFTKQCNLIRHAVVHSGEKPYECSLCGKCFTQRSSLKSHQKTAH